MAISIKINDREIIVEASKTVLEAVVENGVYLPALCFYPGLGRCASLKAKDVVYWGDKGLRNDEGEEAQIPHLCLVEIKGKEKPVEACTTFVQEGMEIYTDTAAVQEERRRRIEHILHFHPHACISCNLADGCDRKICSMGIAEDARCCWKFGNCEFQKIASYIGFDKSISYSHWDAPVVDDNPLFTRDYGLCIACLRCVLACKEIAGRDAVGFVVSDGKTLVGLTAPTLKEAGCKFCLACVEVCPTGALREKNPKRKRSRLREGIKKPILPPEHGRKLMPLDAEAVASVPDCEGVYRLWDKDGNIYQITGTENLRDALLAELDAKAKEYLFDYEIEMMYTSRESQLIQQHLKKFGRLPPGNDETDDLF